jgi:cobaltochelatase CobT
MAGPRLPRPTPGGSVLAAQEPVAVARRAIGAALRTLAARSGIAVSYVAGPPSVRGLAVYLPVPGRSDFPVGLPAVRGMADTAALLLRYRDAHLYSLHLPRGESAQRVFEALTLARVEAIGVTDWPGAVANISAALAHELEGAAGTVAGELALYVAIRQLARERFLGIRAGPSARAAAAAYSPKLLVLLERNLAELKSLLRDEGEFLRRARELLRDLELFSADELVCAADVAADTRDPDTRRGDAGTGAGNAGEPSAESSTSRSGDDQGIVLGNPVSAEISGYFPAFEPARERRDESAYRAYTTRFDAAVDAGQLCDADELVALRAQLDEQVADSRGVTGRLAHRLQRQLQAQQLRGWDFDREEGLLDSGRLCRVLVDPNYSQLFKVEKQSAFGDAVVSLLIDNSGSMRGEPIRVAASVADLLARTLERCSVKVEILGFTTAAWKGGQSRALWERAGKPRYPGRLNDLLHIVYKSADAPWRRARKGLGAMLRDDLLKENVDGEALQWAHQRLLTRPERRKILMVVSDGAPIDDSTLSANGGGYLERHLRAVIEQIGKDGRVELAAIGIGHDVRRYYPRAVRIFAAEELGGVVMREFTELFSPGALSADARRDRSRERSLPGCPPRRGREPVL